MIVGYSYSLFNNHAFSSGDSLDPDAQLFLTNSVITDSTEQSATNQLVLDIKALGIWNKMIAVYLWLGSSASTSRLNLVNPVDSNAAFRLTFYGGWTYSALGGLPNGTNAYADPYINALTNLSSTSFTIGTYLNSPIISNRYHFGVSGGSASTVISLRNSSTTNKVGYLQSTVLPLNKTVNTTTNQGFWAISKRADNDRTMICSDGTFVNNTSAAAITNPNLGFAIAAQNVTGTISSYDTMRHAFDFFAQGLTNAELTGLRTAVINFQTTLSRAV